MTAQGVAAIVQFPHPGNEHRPRSDDMPWNRGRHGRKFLVCTGDYVDTDGRHDNVEIAFWGEWEPPSRVEQRWNHDGDLPRALHRPFWTRPSDAQFRQNTDPWVFGDRMRYSNCRQTGRRPSRNPSALQRLPRGSVICFGSKVNHQFCLDTVFVVADHEPWRPDDIAHLDIDDAFTVCTANALATSAEDARLPLTLYRGATAYDPVHGMYSFAPARRTNTVDVRFARPTVHLDGVINPTSAQSPRGTSTRRPLTQIRQHWAHIRDQVLDKDLGLAVRLDTPAEHTDTKTAVPSSKSHRC